jgi:DNA (cytosine-5)-methyltransferase 1
MSSMLDLASREQSARGAGSNTETIPMLGVDEIRAGMAFTDGYRLFGSKRARVRMLGNAVTPPAARDLVACLVEAITGDPIEVPT